MGTFTDDEGTTHTWAVAAPKIVTGAFHAITLMDMGLPASQVMGTFGERGTEGSNINSVFATTGYFGEVKGDHGDHANAEHAPDVHFLSDPSPAEQALLAQMIDVSPGCSMTNKWCKEFNTTILDIHGWPDVIIAETLWARVNDEVKAKAAQRGIPVIMLEDQNAAGTEWKTFIDLAERFEDLAKALGADVEAHTAQDKQSFCAQAAEFREISREASERGVRALAGYMPYGSADPDTGNIDAFLQPPDKNPALMMLEELGMGIIHLKTTDNYYEWMVPAWGGVNMPATGIMSTPMSNGERVAYNADFFLYEPRGALDFTSDSFAAAWPHPAVVAKQYAYYPITALHYSWSHATDILAVVGAKLRTAAKLDPAEVTHSPNIHSPNARLSLSPSSSTAPCRPTSPACPLQTECTSVEVIDSEHHRTTGLGPGQYACWNPVSYDMCQRYNWQAKATLAGACGRLTL